MRRILALSTFVFLAGTSTAAFADEAPSRPKKSESDKSESDKSESDKSESDKSEKNSGCSVSAEDDAMLGLATLVLLVSGIALRRRPW